MTLKQYSSTSKNKVSTILSRHSQNSSLNRDLAEIQDGNNQNEYALNFNNRSIRNENEIPHN